MLYKQGCTATNLFTKKAIKRHLIIFSATSYTYLHKNKVLILKKNVISAVKLTISLFITVYLKFDRISFK